VADLLNHAGVSIYKQQDKRDFFKLSSVHNQLAFGIHDICAIKALFYYRALCRLLAQI